MIGRRIGFKALENMLQQLWARRGVLNIVYISQDYYLVTFTNEEDQQTALMEGLWLIYDHCLTVCEWSPSFYPTNDAVEQLVVWVRIPRLRI